MKVVKEFDFRTNEEVNKYIACSYEEAKNLAENQRATAGALRRLRQIIWDEVIPECGEDIARKLISITDDMTKFIDILTGNGDEV